MQYHLQMTDFLFQPCLLLHEGTTVGSCSQQLVSLLLVLGEEGVFVVGVPLLLLNVAVVVQLQLCHCVLKSGLSLLTLTLSSKLRAFIASWYSRVELL